MSLCRQEGAVVTHTARKIRRPTTLGQAKSSEAESWLTKLSSVASFRGRVREVDVETYFFKWACGLWECADYMENPRLDSRAMFDSSRRP